MAIGLNNGAKVGHQKKLQWSFDGLYSGYVTTISWKTKTTLKQDETTSTKKMTISRNDINDEKRQPKKRH